MMVMTTSSSTRVNPAGIFRSAARTGRLRNMASPPGERKQVPNPAAAVRGGCERNESVEIAAFASWRATYFLTHSARKSERGSAWCVTRLPGGLKRRRGRRLATLAAIARFAPVRPKPPPPWRWDGPSGGRSPSAVSCRVCTGIRSARCRFASRAPETPDIADRTAIGRFGSRPPCARRTRHPP